MPVLSPVVWVVLIAAALQCMTGLGWWMTSHQLDKAQEAVRRCNVEHQVFVNQTRYQAEQAKARAQQIEHEQRRIQDETAKGWAAALDYVRADAARRVRLAAAGSAGGRGLSSPGTAAQRTDDATESALPAAETIVADCAEDVLKLTWLQDFLRRANIAATEPGREKHE